WAEFSEKVSDILGIEIKYGGGPKKWSDLLLTCSSCFASHEKLVLLDFELERLERDKRSMVEQLQRIAQQNASMPGGRDSAANVKEAEMAVEVIRRAYEQSKEDRKRELRESDLDDVSGMMDSMISSLEQERQNDLPN